MSLRVKVGKEVDADVVVLDNADRSFLIRTVLIVGILFLGGAAAFGLYKGDFAYLAAVWGTVAPIYGGVAGYLMGNRQSKN